MAFFASPAKDWLTQRLDKRNHPMIQKAFSQETTGHPMMGLPSDPAGDIDEALREVREEVEARRRRGNSASMPTGENLRRVVESKLGKKI